MPSRVLIDHSGALVEVGARVVIRNRVKTNLGTVIELNPGASYPIALRLVDGSPYYADENEVVIISEEEFVMRILMAPPCWL